MTKLTDSKRFRLPYRDAAVSARPGYLRKRMQQYREMQQQEALDRETMRRDMEQAIYKRVAEEDAQKELEALKLARVVLPIKRAAK